MRTSTDFRVQLTQTFTLVPGELELQVVMTVKNILSLPLSDVVLDRYFDGDLDGTASDDRYDNSADSAWGVDGECNGWNGNFNHGLMLTQAPSPVAIPAPRIQNFSVWTPFGGTQFARSCGGSLKGTGGPADAVGRISTSLGNLAAGASRTVTYRYRRF
jgi:hypothetical protein